MNNSYTFPKLTEQKTKTILNNTLKNCNNYKNNMYNIYYNLVFFLLFIIIFIILIYWKKKTRLTDKEKKIKKDQYDNYILDKIKSLNKKNEKINLITNLPKFKTF